jgi:hypothetical protein
LDFPPDPFREKLLGYFDDLRQQVSTEKGDWTVKGFIDIYQRIYTISLDTKVLSKVMELVMFPVIDRFAQENHYRIVLARAQNQYPDISLISEIDDSYYALDIKTTYRTGVDRQGRMKVNGMTLGTFGGYFRDRERTTISTFPYNHYKRHYVLGVLYSQVPDVDERRVYAISTLEEIPSVAKDFEFFLHEKYRIAADRAGSGNTKNIGSTVFLDRLLDGSGVFAELGIEIFDDYWRNYRTRAMAKAEGFETTPYSNLIEYKRFKEQGAAILQIPEANIATEALEEDDNNLEASQEE